MKTDLVVRRAATHEYDAVMAINNDVYDGWDYLPTYYHIYLQDPACHPYVCSLNGQIVGFMVYRVTDGGMSLVSVAGRVKSSMNSKGIFGRFSMEVYSKVLAKVPSVRFVVNSGIGAKHFDLLETAIKTGDADKRIILKWNLLLYTATVQQIRSALAKGTSQRNLRTKSLGANDVERVFSDSTNMACLFPAGFLICYQNWRPLRASYDTVKQVTRSHHTVCTYREGSTSKLRAASFCHTVAIKLGPRFDIYYYDIMPDLVTLKQHVIEQLQHVVSISPPEQKINVMLHFPLDYDRGETKMSLKPLVGDNMVSQFFNRETAVSLERVAIPPPPVAKL